MPSKHVSMQAAPKPINEAARLRSLSEYRILGTKPEQAFDNITRMASEICQLSLIHI